MKKTFALLVCFFALAVATGQTTTSSIKGIVKSSSNELLPGASILAVHTPTGTKYSAVSNEDGRFSILNMRIGGPYKITVTFVGFQNQEYTDINLDLGKPFNLTVQLADESQALDEVKIVSKDKVFKSGKTGAETTIGRRELTALPTISRSAEDFTRLEPTASGGSFGGRNDQYNNYSLNGAVFNNPFGLDAATPGGQTGAQPISLDAIEQIQVATAPYDVTLSGFTGASVNAVTKSGTNEFHGTAYVFYRDQDLTGDKIKGEKIFVPTLEQTQAGFSLGAPIIKDKLFIFGNFEIDRRSDLGSNFVANNNDGVTGINESRVMESDLIAVSNALKGLGYDPGAYQGFIHESNSNKGIIKVDWNINDNHKLAVIYNFLDASKDKTAHPTALGFRGPNASILQFQNSGYQINNNLSSFLAELNSKFSESVSNKLQAGYSHFNDYRVPFSVPAPVITIQDGGGSNYIIAGHEPFSINNTLDQKVIQITDNLTYTVGKHAFTFGASFEKFGFKNSFNLAGYDKFRNQATDPVPYYGTFRPYGSVTDFLADAALPFASSSLKQNFQHAQDVFNTKSQFEVGTDGGWKLAELNVGQLAFYAQDDFSVSDDFKLSVGLRIDKPLYFNTADLIQKYIDTDNGGAGRNNDILYYNPQTGQAVPLISTDLPSDKILWSPRVGFNWDVNGDATSQLRGGSGIFTGRIPFVWLGNQVSGADDSFLQIMDPDYKWPQVWRTSLGFDHRFKSNYIVTLDLSYNKDINAVQVQNWGLKPPTGTLAGVDNRAIYVAADHGANNAYVMTNSNKGSAFNATVKVQKTFENGLYASVAYNYLKSKDVNSIEAEITGDAFAFNPALGNVNNAVLSNSKYGDNHRFIGVASKKWKYGKDKWATTVSTFLEYAQGGRFNYTYGGDINGDGSAVNDLIYIPTTAEIALMTFSGPGQGEAFDKFISQDDYMKNHRGQYADRYGAISPWRGRCDLKLMQDYNFRVSSASEKKNTIQFSIDILNFGNLINSDWGVVQVPTSVQPIGVTVVGNTPTYTFNNTQTKTFSYDASLTSRWQAQFGIRYIF
ncbi:carboxypeptidase regulatory-like domain-containing protein [Flavobacterium sp. ov086]|uniref:TonB-dependent receptor n=1 Tax=Flavobacterium sp. ov086 TaxID=1761785 RepID=UPI000B7576FF|nr:carboxypeptidase regulatory-like domain-containing protein [Flavobacterium sp. ov086]SNR36843.1 Carboxypeptidase regulatory-like domain-containing protein [Flavobacterium sp. ov086]